MRKTLLFIALLISLFGFLSIRSYLHFYDHKLHVVFCDVGQGDAILIKTPEGATMLFDGGPDESAMDCLGTKLPFWQRKLTLLLLSHPHADHFTGFLSVLDAYHVQTYASEQLGSKIAIFQKLLQEIDRKGVKKQELFAGDKFRFRDGVSIEVLSPTREFLTQVNPEGTIGDSKEFASLVLLVRYQDFSLLLTGDSQNETLASVAHGLPHVSVMQISHHGSSTGTSADLLRSINPQLAVISVGKKNRYHFPTMLTLAALHETHIPVLRTDQKGTIELTADGKGFRIN